MALPTRLAIAKRDILRLFQTNPTRVCTRADIERILAENREFWRLAQSTTVEKFIEFLTKQSPLQVIPIEFPNRRTHRYTWGEVPVFEVVQSLKPRGYFTHYTAMYLHALTEQIPKTVYLNDEQAASGGGGDLTQSRIDYAFKKKCRVSHNDATIADFKVCLLNGKNTGQLGVMDFETPEGSRLRVTNLERTLIDIAVRPVYSGGVFEVARAFEMARDRLSVNKLAAILSKLDFTYPYHQAIGFYLERAGEYSESQLDLLRQIPMTFDFYLAHQMKDPDYVARWRLFVPKGF